MALLDYVRSTLFLTSGVTDVVLQGYIDAALADMARVGVRPELLAEESMSPIAQFAVAAFCNANYNTNASTSPLWSERYRMAVTAMMNSNLSDYIDGPASDDSDDETADGSGEGGAGLGMSAGGD